MVTEAKAAFGVQFLRNGNAIGELTSVGDIDLTLETEDVTSHESPGGYREKIGTVLEGGSVSLEGNFLPGNTLGQIGMKTDMEAKTLQNFEIVFPSAVGASWQFSALVTHFKIGSMPVDGKLTWEAEVEISGQPTLNITASTGLTTPFFSVSGAGTLLVPAASGSVYTYVADIVTGVSSVTITPTASAGVITITANGASQVVASGNASSAITLGAAGSITTATIQVKETGKTAKTYTVHLTRAA
jgi:predicted secreted protein